MTFTVIVNGAEQQCMQGETVASLLSALNLPADTVVVEQNTQLVPKENFSKTVLSAADRIEIVHFVGGG